MLLHMGGYAYVWYDPSVPAKPEEKRLLFHFRSVGKAYARRSWEPNGLLVGDATLATFPANATPAYATNAALSLAAIDNLVTQISWIKPIKQTPAK